MRPPREEDVELAYSWDRDPELAAWNGRSPINLSLGAARRDYLRRWRDRSVKTFIIEVDGEAVGMATLYDFRHDSCEIGIKIGARSLWGRNLGTETVKLLVSYAFEELDLKAVRGSTLAHNRRMQRVFEKCGFELAGEGSIVSGYDSRRYTELFYERRRDDQSPPAR
ncbi:GNAT family N-acetyltransferase [Rubrobacter taiwanensis]|uniref:GNAT family N-acetyltransferase n=1 Tax=Rubrobacter taiwanensis TaxID=185139 RepID=UPI002436815A|nr:GNAT family N-acetyltransferase [Rubrobacter taiwanensis]